MRRKEVIARSNIYGVREKRAWDDRGPGKHCRRVADSLARLCEWFNSDLLESNMIVKANGWGRVMLAYAAGLVLAWAATPATAGLIAYEPFIQESGNPNPDLVGNWTGGTGFGDNYWTWKTGHGRVVNSNSGVQYTDSTGKSLVQSGSALQVLSGNLMGTTDLTRTFTNAVPTTGTYYMSAVFHPVATSCDWGIGLPGTNWQLSFNADAGVTGNYWGLIRTSNNSGPQVDCTPMPTVATLLVAKIVKDSPTGSATATLWVNPLLGNEAGSGTGATAAIAGNTTWSGIKVLAYMDVALDAGTLLGTVADVRLGTSFGDVTPTVPEPSTVVLVVTGVMGLLAYAWRKRK
jgi:hypothetical protein